MKHVYAGHGLEQLTGEMLNAPVADGRHIDLAGIRFRIGDEFWNGLCRNRWIDHHEELRAIDGRDWSDVVNEIEIEIIVDRRLLRVC
jgi:hypothetical protein